MLNRARGGFTAATALLLLAGLGCGPQGMDDGVEQYQVAHRLRFVVPPSDGRAGQAFSPPVEVEIVDGSGQRVEGLETLVRVQLPSEAQSTNLRGATVFTKDGRGVFHFLTVMHPGAYELEAQSLGLLSARSAPFTIRNALSDTTVGEAAEERAR